MQIAAYKGRSFTSKLIRWQTRSDYSHVGMFFPQELNVARYNRTITTIPAGSIIEAWQVGGVRLNYSLGEVHSGRTEVDLFDFIEPLNIGEEFAIANALLDEIGKGYDFRSVARFVTRMKESPWDKDRWFCSELVHHAVRCSGRSLQNCEHWKVSPRDVAISPLLKFNRTVLTTNKSP